MARRKSLTAVVTGAVVAGLLAVATREVRSPSTVAPTSSSAAASRTAATAPAPVSDTASGAISSAPIRPDPHLTPGAVLPVSVQDICTPGYSKKVRNVPVAVKRQVYAEYGIMNHQSGDYEVDHLISLELGGSNSIKNLWPQSYRTQPWNAHVKDALENALHREVCAGRLDLATAQHLIASDWIAAYPQYVHRTRRTTTP